MIILILRTFLSALRSHRALALENLALRHQLEVLQRNAKRPRLKNGDRALWVILSRLWGDWRKSLGTPFPRTLDFLAVMSGLALRGSSITVIPLLNAYSDIHFTAPGLFRGTIAVLELK